MVTDDLVGQPCVLCGSPSTPKGEHVWPHWLAKTLANARPFTIEQGGKTLKKQDGTAATHNGIVGSRTPMCEPCNNALNTLVEMPAKDVVRTMLSKSSDGEWPALSGDDAAALGRWFIKIALLLAHPATIHRDPHVRLDPASRVSPFPDDLLDWMRARTDPPGGFTVFVSRRDPHGDAPWQGEPSRLTLPGRVIDDGVEWRSFTRTVGVRGLSVDVVWHPGWPIEHPHVDDGRAAVLWPEPGPVDLVALPEVHPRELAFCIDAGEVVCIGDQFSRLTRMPLGVGRSPMTIWQHVFLGQSLTIDRSAAQLVEHTNALPEVAADALRADVDSLLEQSVDRDPS